MEQSFSQKIIRNTFYNAVGRVWGILVSLFLTPYIIHHIGIEKYGIWTIVGVITGYFGLLDFGIGASFIKYIAEYKAKKDYEKLNQLVNTGFVFYSLFAVIIVAVGLLSINSLVAFFHIPSHLQKDAFFVFSLGLIIFSISNALSPFVVTQVGLQRMDISNKVAVILSIPNVVGTIILLRIGYGLPGLMINNAIIFIISSIINIVIAFNILPELRFRPLLFSNRMLKKLFSFGYKIQVSRFSALVSFQTDKLIITYFLGIGFVTFYQLGSSLLQQIRQIPLLLVSALVPAVSEMEVRKDQRSLVDLYLSGSKYLILVSAPIMFFVVINASLIMQTWMGEKYELAALVIQILAVGYFMSIVSGVASSVAVGVGKTEFEMIYGFVTIILNLFLSIFLIIKIGFIGAVLGTSFSLILGQALFLMMFHKYLGTPLDGFFKLMYKPIIACFIGTLIILSLNYAFRGMTNIPGRFVHLCILGFNGMLFVSSYIAVIILSGYLDETDINRIKNSVPVLRHIL